MIEAKSRMQPRLSFLSVVLIGVTLIALSSPSGTLHESGENKAARNYLGFDLNIFPGNDALPILRKTFAFGGYWLSSPPGEKTNTWLGKRELMSAEGFGFLLLYRGRKSQELKVQTDAVEKGTRDARDAVSIAKSEGFAPHSIIFLDIEEGGRLAAGYHSYLRSWSAELARGGYRPGAYCSGIPVNDGPGVSITSADDIRAHAPSQDFVFFIYNDVCPPSPGCAFPLRPPSPADSGIPYAAIWQFAQSPRRKQFTAHCPPGYHTDGNCYVPSDAAHMWFLDVNAASTPNPSGGAR